jgi:hypothetical protein
MELIYFFIGLLVFAIAAGIWGYWDYRKEMKKTVNMEAIAGIEYTKDVTGKKRYVQIDLDMYGENQLIEDFLDLLDIESCKGDYHTVTRIYK